MNNMKTHEVTVGLCDEGLGITFLAAGITTGDIYVVIAGAFLITIGSVVLIRARLMNRVDEAARDPQLDDSHLSMLPTTG